MRIHSNKLFPGYKNIPKPILITLSMLLMFLLLAVNFSAHAKVHKPGPDTNLQELSEQLKTGDIIQLGPWRYYGQLLIEKKSITVRGAKNGKTRLYDPGLQSLVYVGTGGKVTLDNIRFKVSGKSQTAVYIKGGKAILKRCVIKRAPRQAIFVENGSLTASHCRFNGIGSEVIFATKNSTITVKSSTFTNIKNRAVLVQGGSQASIVDSRFVNIGANAVLALSKSKISISSTSFLTVSDTAIHAEQGSQVVLSKTNFRNIKKYAITGLKGTAINISGGAFTQIRGVAVVSNNATEVSISGTRFSDVDQAIVIGKQGTRVSLVGIKVSQASKSVTAISIDDASSINIKNSFLLNVGEGISVNGKTAGAVIISNNTILNSSARGLVFSASGNAESKAMIADNKFINSGKSAVLVDDNAQVNFSGNLVLARASVAVFVNNNSNIVFSNNIIYGKTKSIYFHSSAGTNSRLVQNILVRDILKSGKHSMIIPDSRFRFLTNSSQNRQALISDITKILQTANAVKNASGLSVISAEIQKFKTRIAGLKSQAGQLSSIIVKAVDVSGREFTPPYTVYNVYDAVISQHNSDNPVATVAPGSYYIKSTIGDGAKKEVQLVAGQAGNIKITASNYRVLGLTAFTTKKGWVTTWVPFLFRSTEQRKKALALQQLNLWAVRRDHANTIDMARSLSQVRSKLPRLRSEYAHIFPKNNTPTARKEMARWNNAVLWTHQVLAIAGNASDARQLFGLASKVNELRKERLSLAAYIESRLGILQQGSVISGIGSANPFIRTQSAVLLHQHGRAEGDKVLLANIRLASNSANTVLSVKTLLNSSKPEVLEAMRQLVQNYIAKRQSIELSHGSKSGAPALPHKLWDAAANAAVYLYTWGTSDDAQLASKITYKDKHFAVLAKLVRDPKPLVNYYLGLRGPIKTRYSAAWAASVCNSLRFLPGGALSNLDNFFETALIKAGTISKVSKKTRRDDIAVARAKYNIAKSQCRANNAVARMVINQKTRLLRNTPWIAKPWLYNLKLRELKNGNPYAAKVLEHASSGVLAASLASARNNSKVRYPGLLLAYARIGKQHCKHDQCAFVISHKQSPRGALSGVLKLNKVLAGKRQIEVNFTLDVAAHNSSGQSSGFGQYIVHGGKALVAEVFVKILNRKYRLKRAKSTKGLRFVLRAPNVKLDNAYLYVRLKLFNEGEVLGFPLFMHRN